MEGMLHEKSLCKVLTAAYKSGGYEIIPGTIEAGPWKRHTIIINGAAWAIRCETNMLPREAAVQVVKDVGYLPMEPMMVNKNGSTQAMLPEMAEKHNGLLPDAHKGAIPMKKIPVIYRDRWQLYQTEKGEVYAFDVELLKIIDFKTVGKSDEFTTNMAAGGVLGIFAWRDWTVYIAPGRFSGADLEKIQHIASMDWENQIEQGDPITNITLFDAADVAPVEQED